MFVLELGAEQCQTEVVLHVDLVDAVHIAQDEEDITKFNTVS